MRLAKQINRLEPIDEPHGTTIAKLTGEYLCYKNFQDCSGFSVETE
jgi:hypothetical protein